MPTIVPTASRAGPLGRAPRFCPWPTPDCRHIPIWPHWRNRSLAGATTPTPRRTGSSPFPLARPNESITWSEDPNLCPHNTIGVSASSPRAPGEGRLRVIRQATVLAKPRRRQVGGLVAGNLDGTADQPELTGLHDGFRCGR